MIAALAADALQIEAGLDPIGLSLGEDDNEPTRYGHDAVAAFEAAAVGVSKDRAATLASRQPFAIQPPMVDRQGL